MITLTNSYVNVASDAVLTNCIVTESVIDSDCTNVVSPTFISCTDSYCVSGDDSAIGTGSQNLNLSTAFVDAANGDYRINQYWANANLIEKGLESSDIIDWAYYLLTVMPSLDIDSVTRPSLMGSIKDYFINCDNQIILEFRYGKDHYDVDNVKIASAGDAIPFVVNGVTKIEIYINNQTVKLQDVKWFDGKIVASLKSIKHLIVKTRYPISIKVWDENHKLGQVLSHPTRKKSRFSVDVHKAEI